MSKYKYYFRKPKSEIVKDILLWLAISGAVYVAATSPYFIRNLIKVFKKSNKYNKKKIYDTFYMLQKEDCIKIDKQKNQIYISLTEKGRKKAGWLQIDNLKLKNSKKWDKKWRIVIFDIAQLKKLHREAFRGKLKELNFYPLQKSVWIYPFKCKDEIDLLRDFFGLSQDEVRLIVSNNIGKEEKIKKMFGL